MLTRAVTLTAVLCMLLLPSTASALWAEPPQRAPWAMFSGLSLSIEYQHLTLNEALARANGLGTAAGGFNVDFSVRLWRLLSLNLAFGHVSVNDRASFTQTTITCPTPTPCDERTGGVVGDMTSDAGALTITGSVGLGPPPIAFGNLLVAANVNLGAISADFTRSIDECVDCTYDTLVTVGSGFLGLNAHVGYISESAPGDIGDFAFTCALSGGLRHYLNGEKLANGWSIGVTFGATIGDAIWRPTYVPRARRGGR